MPTLRQLRYLTALEELHSFSKAAARCYVTQSTLSAGIKDLETVLGQSLVHRSRSRATLTPFGQQIIRHARQAFVHIDAIMAEARKLEGPLAGPLRLGVIPTIAPYFLPRILPGLKKQYPKLELQIFEDLTGRLMTRAQAGSLDLILMAFPYETPGFRQEILYEEEFLLACPKAYQKQRQLKDVIDVKHLPREDLLLLEDGHCMTDHALSACKIQDSGRKKEFSASSLPTLIQMVSYGYGVTLLPEMVAREDGIDRKMALIRLKNPSPRRQIGLAWRSGHARSNDFLQLLETLTALQPAPETPQELQIPAKKSIKRA